MNELPGIWVGPLIIPKVAEMRLWITLKSSEDGGLQAWLRFIDQHTGDIPCSRADFDGETLTLTIKHLDIQVQGKVDLAEGVIRGEYTQRGGKFALDLHRSESIPQVSRPQEPTQPYPYYEEEVTYANEEAGVTFSATFTYPKTGGPFPAVVLLTGSGELDRDESAYGHKPFFVLADFLTRQGIAVLRADDRGVGGSTKSEVEASTSDFADDALAGVSYLKSRQEVNPAGIGLIGHSEGAMKASIAATRSEAVCFIVLMAGPGKRFSEVMVHQILEQMRIQGINEEKIAKQKAWRADLYALFKPGRSTVEIERDMRVLYAALSEEDIEQIGWSEDRLTHEIERSLSPWWHFALSHDPAETLSQVRVPILVINGDKDTQNPAEMNITPLQQALNSGSSACYLVKVLPGLNHMFQHAETGSEYEYGNIEETMAPEAMVLIAEWIWRIVES